MTGDLQHIGHVNTDWMVSDSLICLASVEDLSHGKVQHQSEIF